MIKDVRLAIAGIGAYLPEKIIDNGFFRNKPLFYYTPLEERQKSKILQPDAIFQVTGIRERRYAAPGETSSSMGLLAAESALEHARLNPSNLTGIIFASVTERENFPGGASRIASQLGARPSFAYDLNAACAGFVHGLIQASALAYRSPGNYLVIGSEHMSSITDTTDINSTLFGDGAGAVVLTPSNSERGIMAYHAQSEPLEGKVNYIFRGKNNHVRMPDGVVVLKEAVRSMVNSCKEVKLHAGWDRADVYIPHQANVRILEGVEKRIEDSGSRVYKTVDKYGNMSSATCPVALHDAFQEGLITFSSSEKPGSKLIITAFGSGLTTASVAVQL